jgi:hypothetical protein
LKPRRRKRRAFEAVPTDARSTLRNVLPPLENRDPGDETAEDEA